MYYVLFLLPSSFTLRVRLGTEKSDSWQSLQLWGKVKYQSCKNHWEDTIQYDINWILPGFVPWFIDEEFSTDLNRLKLWSLDLLLGSIHFYKILPKKIKCEKGPIVSILPPKLKELLHVDMNKKNNFEALTIQWN